MAAKAAWPSAPAARARRTRVLVTALVVLVLAAAALVALIETGVIGSQGVSAEELARVALIAAAPDETGAVIAQVIVLVDVSKQPAEATYLNPATPVTITGTSFNTLADAYPFGGGAGVADAIARAGKVPGEAPAYVAVGPEALAEAVDAAGGLTFRLPADMAVFDGETLFTFRPGRRAFSAAELTAVFKGAPYLEPEERAELDEELGRAFAALLAEWPDAGLQQAAENADISTDISPDALITLVEALTALP